MDAERPQANGISRWPARILLAEDDAELRRLLREVLRDAGHEVTDVPDGGRFLVCVAREHERRSEQAKPSFDLILSDVRMPICTGLQIVEALRQVHWHTPVILLTAFGDNATRVKARHLGATLVDKPVDMDALLAMVEHLVTCPPSSPRA